MNYIVHMASKNNNNKNKLKGQRSVLTLIKDKEVSKLNSGDNSDTYSEGKTPIESAARTTNLTPRRKRKERSPQEPINPQKKSISGITQKRNSD